MATKRGEKRNIDDNERISRCNTEKSSEAKKRIRLSDDNVEEKLLRTNSQIISKLEVLITRQKNLKTRLSSIKKKLKDNNKNNNNTIDLEYVKELVKKVSKILFENFVYPSQDEYKLATEKYLKDENPEFMRQFKKNQWIIFFEKKIAPTLVQQVNNIEAYEKRSRLESKTLCILFSKRLGINYRLLTLRLVHQRFRNGRQKLENRDKFTHSDDDSHDGNDVDDSGNRAADDRAGAADDGATNDGRPNDGTANDGAANDDAANDGIADDDILSIDSYNTEEEGRYVNSLLKNYGLHRK
ncbi:hypothetical protein GLOIN_2v1482020 [Rhizophagus irregularis DAOM 181602=DAOM 197198]|uniref:Uncharacterized protein n=1 Tax=Rhizophagus irregularis (strain DAOM 181602 / DAOM 197198 / MUCL 43194) TaxID=747089 RepID=A0A2P4PN27_RHIID|nr:hypothetical protein GLOIN_2v1482020 [Rhizophagus irregularis DAOM 181602=DAOM 197198]POG66798.1 hypothetical protein GLOIN_2v1482020 [Rhizophagus irregularis DAOM 181602=DAOM 197198]|eukprot:XP_025173664.1 hypothetical protein GLOIN_2v1482020 [Rhizophagus irregularis DAOM 181602=DAOM 197198]